MPLRDEIAGRFVATTAVIDVDVIRAGELDVRCDEDRWDAHHGIGEDVVVRDPQTRHRHDEALHTPLEHQAKVGPFVVLGALLNGADDQEVAPLAGFRLGARHRLGKEMVADVGRHHAQRVSPVG